jgi:hypothetical protein
MFKQPSYKRTLIWWVPFCAGGLGDRIIGMISSYCIAKELNRDFLIKWDQNDLSDVIPINPKYDFYKHEVPFTKIIHNNEASKIFFETASIEHDWSGLPHVLIWSNLNLYQHYCKRHPHIPYQQRFLEAISEIFTNFLLPIPEVFANIPSGLENAIGIHIRTHDNQIDIKNTENRNAQVPYITDILQRCKQSIEEKKEGNVIFIASDCTLSPVLAQKIFGADYTIISCNGPIIHSGREQAFINKEGMVRVVVDMLALAKCKELYLGWNTNFSRFGALLNPNRQFYTFEHPEHPKEIYDCSLLEWMNYHSIGGRW